MIRVSSRISQLFLIVCSIVLYSTHAEASSTKNTDISFGILSISPPFRTYTNWQPFIEYVSKKMQRPMKIIIPRGFKKIKLLAANGDLDFFYINSYVYYRLKQESKAQAILQMKNIKGDIFSRSEIFVRSDKNINNIEQLGGKSISYVSPMGAGGYLAPRAYLVSRGMSSDNKLKESFTKNLSSTVHNVLLNDTVAGTMCGVNLNIMKKKIDMGELKILAVSDPYPENVIAIRKSLDMEMVNKFKDVVKSMKNDIEGRKILGYMHKLKIQEFIDYDESVESITKKLLIQADIK